MVNDQNEPIQRRFNDEYEYVMNESMACNSIKSTNFNWLQAIENYTLNSEKSNANWPKSKQAAPCNDTAILRGLFACHLTHNPTALVH